MTQKNVKLSKSFFRKERDQFYSDWFLAFWRELFQNSTDAGAKNIDIFLDEKNGRGTFNEVRNNAESVIRVVFADDGCGMDFNTLDKVYFHIGESTKTGDSSSVGGFGRARLMTCFSQDRYSILTHDNFVMGEGDRYEIMTFETAEQKLAAYLDHVRRATEEVPFEDNHSLLGLSNDLEIVRQAKEKGGYPGCRVEIDLETVKDDSYYFGKPASLYGMKEALLSYLQESQIKAALSINGKNPETYFEKSEKIELRRGRLKTRLSLNDDVGQHEFASVYVNKRKDDKAEGKMIVRVDGASMFSETISSLEGVNIIVEIDPERSRQVLNSNRDGLARNYNRVVRDFNHSLAIDVKSALMDKKSKSDFVVKGEHGVFKSEAKTVRSVLRSSELSGSFAEPYLAGSLKANSKPVTASVTALRQEGIGFDAILALTNSIRNFDSVFDELVFKNIDNDIEDKLDTFINNIRRMEINKVTLEADFLNAMPKELLPWVVQSVKERLDANKKIMRDEHEQKLKGMHDAAITIISTNEKTKAAIRRNNPTNWDTEKGTGKVPHALLTGWTTAVSMAVEGMMFARPNTEVFKWRTGWVYKIPELVWESDGERPRGIEAIHQTREEGNNEVHEILLNPVDEEGKIAYSITRDADIWKLIVLAAHEVAHVAVKAHTEDFANLSDDILKSINPIEALKRIKKTMAATTHLYGRKNLKVQAMDDQPGKRPAERLMEWGNGNSPTNTQSHEDDYASGLKSGF